ncbi:unnamed protein product, partial [marine sediment metagenome]
RYSVGIDLSLSLGSKALARDSARGKIPLMVVTGRIEGTKWVEQKVRYRLPHEVALDVFVRRNLFLKLLRQIGKPKGPDLTKPPYNLPSDLPKFSSDKF